MIFREFLVLTKNSLKKIEPTNYSKSLRLGLRDGSLERNPKINKETKNIIVV